LPAGCGCVGSHCTRLAEGLRFAEHCDLSAAVLDYRFRTVNVPNSANI
jgi:hypothetical protein